MIFWKFFCLFWCKTDYSSNQTYTFADIPNYNRQPRQLVNDQKKAVFVNGRFSRGIKNFKPSPQVSNKKEIDYLMGEWMPGNIPGEYNWKGLNRNPMHQRHSSIGENVYYWSYFFFTKYCVQMCSMIHTWKIYIQSTCQMFLGCIH